MQMKEQHISLCVGVRACTVEPAEVKTKRQE